MMVGKDSVHNSQFTLRATVGPWAGPGEGRTFRALANVGLFFSLRTPPLAPDVMLSIDVPVGRDLSRKENNSYLMWEMGKPPDVVIEVVSDGCIWLAVKLHLQGAIEVCGGSRLFPGGVT